MLLLFSVRYLNDKLFEKEKKLFFRFTVLSFWNVYEFVPVCVCVFLSLLVLRVGCWDLIVLVLYLCLYSNSIFFPLCLSYQLITLFFNRYFSVPFACVVVCYLSIFSSKQI